MDFVEKNFMKLIYLISRVFGLDFFKFWANNLFLGRKLEKIKPGITEVLNLFSKKTNKNISNPGHIIFFNISKKLERLPAELFNAGMTKI